MLCERMDTHHHMRTPLLELLSAKTCAPIEKEITLFRTELVHQPIQIFHVMLPVAQHPIVEANQFFSDVMRLLHRLQNPDCGRVPMPKSFDTFGNGLRCRSVTSSGIRGEDKNLWCVFGHRSRLAFQFNDRVGGANFAVEVACRLLHLLLELLDLHKMLRVER